jgi:hypothetical protein
MFPNQFGPYWTIFDHLGHYQSFLGNFWPFWSFLGHNLDYRHFSMRMVDFLMDIPQVKKLLLMQNHKLGWLVCLVV